MVEGTKAPIKVIYIMGAGRSGSTVLDTVLGNHPRIASFGELINLPVSGWRNNEYCACKRRVNDCGFWNDVRAEWLRHMGGMETNQYSFLQERFMRQRPASWIRHLLTPGSSQGLGALKEGTYQMFAALQSVSGRPVIVDSSKSPSRAAILANTPGIDLRVIHLVRDGRGVAWSLKKAHKRDDAGGVQRNLPSRPALRTALFWLWANLQSEMVCRRLPSHRWLRVRYESMVCSPRDTFRRIGAVVDEDLSGLADRVIEGSAMEVGHTVAGSRHRMNGRVRVALDTEWKQSLPWVDRTLFVTISGWLMHRYGYTLRGD